MAMQFPKGKFISMVKVGEKGQIVIPKGARDHENEKNAESGTQNGKMRVTCFRFSRETISCCWPTRRKALRSCRRSLWTRRRRSLRLEGK